MVCLVFCIGRLAPLLFRSWRSALTLWFALSAASIASLFAVTPFRLWMPRWANDGRRRWYYTDMPFPENDYPRWLSDWSSFRPHLFESAVLLIFFALLIVPCALFYIRLWSAVLVCSLGCAFLAIAPVPPNLQKLYVDCWSHVIPRFVERLQTPKHEKPKTAC